MANLSKISQAIWVNFVFSKVCIKHCKYGIMGAQIKLFQNSWNTPSHWRYRKQEWIPN